MQYDSLWVSKMLTYGMLAMEFALCTLIWIKEFRYFVLAAGLMLHLGLEWSSNLPVFQHMIVACYVLFVYPQDLQKCIDRVKSRLAGRRIAVESAEAG